MIVIMNSFISDRCFPLRLFPLGCFPARSYLFFWYIINIYILCAIYFNVIEIYL